MATQLRKTPSIQRIALSMIMVTPLLFAQSAFGQSNDAKKDVQQKLAAQLALTTVTANRYDLVKPGAIFTLQKDGLQMTAVAAPIPPLCNYKNGKLSQSFGSSLGRGFLTGMVSPGGQAPEYPKRTFVSGEKFWLTGLAVQNDGVVYQFYSDPYDDVRYYGQVKIPFAKGAIPSVPELIKALSEVATPQSLDGVTESATSPPPPGPPAAEQAPLEAIAPPPPPSDAPPPQPQKVVVGETKDQVAASLGPPQKVVNLGPKEIDYYPGMKVVFLKGKVSVVQ